MAKSKEHSFDISAKLDMQEMKNAIVQAQKEVDNRYDFKGMTKEIDLNMGAKVLTLLSSSDNKIDAMKDILISKMNKRGVSINSLEETIRTTQLSIIRIANNQQQALVASVKTIAEDWGLRQAIGLKDKQTIVSALDNHRMRVHAEGAVFFGIDGRAIGSNIDISPELLTVWKQMLANQAYSTYQIVQIGGTYYQVVFSEVKAPQKIGWLFM